MKYTIIGAISLYTFAMIHDRPKSIQNSQEDDLSQNVQNPEQITEILVLEESATPVALEPVLAETNTIVTPESPVINTQKEELVLEKTIIPEKTEVAENPIVQQAPSLENPVLEKTTALPEKQIETTTEIMAATSNAETTIVPVYTEEFIQDKTANKTTGTSNSASKDEEYDESTDFAASEDLYDDSDDFAESGDLYDDSDDFADAEEDYNVDEFADASDAYEEDEFL